MPNVPNTAKAQKNLHLTILLDAPASAETDNFAGHVSNVLVAPTSSTVTWAGGTPESQLSDTILGGWTLALNVAQDWDNADALCHFLLAHAGEGATFEYGPDASSAFRSSVHVDTIVPPAIGGAVNQFNESTVTMGCSKPTITPPAP